jgi:hypothetical protein
MDDYLRNTMKDYLLVIGRILLSKNHLQLHAGPERFRE